MRDQVQNSQPTELRFWLNHYPFSKAHTTTHIARLARLICPLRQNPQNNGYQLRTQAQFGR